MMSRDWRQFLRPHIDDAIALGYNEIKFVVSGSPNDGDDEVRPGPTLIVGDRLPCLVHQTTS
jgi:hypothetical protein